MRSNIARCINEVIAAVLILLFIYAAANKLLDYEKFRVQLSQSPLLTSFAGVTSVVVPLMEIGAALLLAIPAYRRWGYYGAINLMAIFTLYIICMLNFSSFIPCSCGGILEKMSWKQHLIFNFFFLFVAITGMLLEGSIHNKKKLEIRADVSKTVGIK